MAMTLDQLHSALELEKTLNFSKAAENCHISQPSLSVQIAKLEQELGSALFVRTRSGVEVSEFGASLLQQARRVVQEAERMDELAKEWKGEVQGTLRLGVIPTLAPTLLPSFLAEFGRTYPKVQLSVVEERTEHLVRDIDSGALDAAILSTPPRCPASLMESVLFYEPFVLFLSRKHPLLERKRVTTQNISSEEILLLDETHCLRDQVLQLCKSKERSGNSKLKIQAASLQTLVEFIRHNEGYTLLPALSTALLSKGEATHNIRSFEKPLPSRKVSLVFHHARLKRSAIEALKQTILGHLPEGAIPAGAHPGLRVLTPDPEHFEI